MNYAEYADQKFPRSSTLHKVIGKDSMDGVLECGFLRKPGLDNSDIDVTFKFYGALLVIDGEGKYIDSDGSEAPIYPGCFVQRLPGRRHSTIVKPGSNWFETFVCFGSSLYSSLEKIGLINKNKPVLNPGLDQLLLKKFVDFYSEMNNDSSRQLPFLLAKAQEIVFLAHRLDETNRAGDKSDIIESACRLIDGSEGVNISALQVARDMNMGYEAFRKLFKYAIGVSPNFYIIQRRLNYAKSLLLDSNKSIKEIALDLGYPDQFSFSKQFKKFCGLNPSEFRSQY